MSVNQRYKHRSRMKFQSATEYLTTYGWALLIIAAILAALIYLGVFNPLTYAPKTPGGGCEVIRPLGPGTTYGMDMRGACSNTLPLYAAVFNGNGHVSTAVLEMNTTSGGYNTVAFWLYWNGYYPEIPISFGRYSLVFYSNSCFGFTSAGSDAYGMDPSNFKNTWIFIVAEFYNGDYTGTSRLYINGVPVQLSNSAPCALQWQIWNPSTSLYIGYLPPSYYKFRGMLANIQLYNTSLDPATINSMYLSGIGGDPQNLQNLIGWWPLNGEAKDYSGNNNDGSETSIEYNTGWYYAYTIP